LALALAVTTAFGKPIIKEKVRILRPGEYNALREGARELENKTNLDTLTLTGLRYVEAQRLRENKDWFDGTFIHLPEAALLKAKRKQKERWVRVSPRGSSVLQYFFEVKALPSYKTWTENLERWAKRSGLDPVGLSPKTTRKTWESWLVSCYPERTAEIFLSQGHTTMTSLHHYLNMPFLRSDKEQMLEWTGGMFDGQGSGFGR